MTFAESTAAREKGGPYTASEVLCGWKLAITAASGTLRSRYIIMGRKRFEYEKIG